MTAPPPPAELHCAGCRGYATGWLTECPGVLPVRAQLVARRMSWPARIRVLLGRPVVTEYTVIAREKVDGT